MICRVPLQQVAGCCSYSEMRAVVATGWVGDLDAVQIAVVVIFRSASFLIALTHPTHPMHHRYA